MEKLVKKHLPSVLLIGATNNGRDLGPRLSCRLKTGLTADCTGLDVDLEKRLVSGHAPPSAETSWRQYFAPMEDRR